MYAKVKSSKAILAIIVFIFVITMYYALRTDSTLEPIIMHWELIDNNVSCHRTRTGDALPSAEDEHFEPAENSIFFLETSCKGGLNSRQACAVESAARANPGRQVYCLFSGPVSGFVLARSCLARLLQFRNVHAARVHVDEFVRGSPLEAVVSGGALNQSSWRVEHTSDALRLVALRRWGGVYLDTDVLVVRPLGALGGNWAARESDYWVNTAALAFSKDPVGRRVLLAVLDEIKKTYTPTEWAYNGPGAITRALHNICSPPETARWSAATCGGFPILGPEYVYPIYWNNTAAFFEPGELAHLASLDSAYCYHMWNRLTAEDHISQDSLYARLAERFCPTIYEMYGDQFGV